MRLTKVSLSPLTQMCISGSAPQNSPRGHSESTSVYATQPRGGIWWRGHRQGKVEGRRTASQIKPVLMGNSRTSAFEPV